MPYKNFLLIFLLIPLNLYADPSQLTDKNRRVANDIMAHGDATTVAEVETLMGGQFSEQERKRIMGRLHAGSEAGMQLAQKIREAEGYHVSSASIVITLALVAEAHRVQPLVGY